MKPLKITPSVGDGCTMSWVTDRHAGTVVYVSKSGRKVVVQHDKAIRTDDNGMSECQSYRFEPDPDGLRRVFWRCDDGSYVHGSVRLTLGVRKEYYDYSF